VVSHPEKVLFPADGITRGELAAYYESMAPLVLRHLRGRPITMERYPSGIGGAGFFQKDVSKGFPDWLQRVEVPKKGGTVHYPLAFDRRAIEWMANQNCITPHVWTSRMPNLGRPDLCIFDLDPSVEDPEALRSTALWVRDLMAELGLPTWVKTTGSKGFHIAIPLDGKADFEEVGSFAYLAGSVLVRRHPEQLTQEFSKADRGRRILVDTGRNGYGATFAAVYAVRAKPGSAGECAVHLAGGRVRGSGSPDLQRAKHGQANRRGGGPVVRHRQTPAVYDAAVGAAAEDGMTSPSIPLPAGRGKLSQWAAP
jgi:bifunctional non-homologous end joining protein LigD